jgi:predicted ATPase
VITSIRLDRFKRFHELSLPTAALTVLTGTNGAGKTSVIHALLLARQAARYPGRGHVELNGEDSLQLGDAVDLIHRQAGGDQLAIEVSDGSVARWVLGVPADERSLNATIVARPDAYSGVLAQPAPAFAYLCAERFGPRDVLGASPVEVSELGVGVHGEFTAQALAVHDRQRVSPARLADDAESGGIASLLHQTEAWMNRIVRPIQIRAEWFPGTSVTQLQFKTPGVQSEWTRPPNMGFGVSYALPIIVAALRAPAGGLLIVENPEAHLHPAGQSRIGGFLAHVAADGVQVLLETHSDHVLNGIRTAVAEGHAALASEQVAIHFFHGENEPGAPVETLTLQRTGQLSEWPPGFFDQAQRDLAVLARLQRRKP